MSEQTKGVFSMSEGFSAYGRITTYIGTAIATIICLVFIYFGLRSINTPDVHTEKIDANITKAECVSSISGNSSVNFNCLLDLQYTVKDKTYNQKINTNSSSNYGAGMKVKIKYNPIDPMSIVADGLSNKASGWLMLGISVFVLIAVWVWTYFVATNSSFSSVVGGVNAIGMLTRR